MRCPTTAARHGNIDALLSGRVYRSCRVLYLLGFSLVSSMCTTLVSCLPGRHCSAPLLHIYHNPCKVLSLARARRWRCATGRHAQVPLCFDAMKQNLTINGPSTICVHKVECHFQLILLFIRKFRFDDLPMPLHPRAHLQRLQVFGMPGRVMQQIFNTHSRDSRQALTAIQRAASSFSKDLL